MNTQVGKPSSTTRRLHAPRTVPTLLAMASVLALASAAQAQSTLVNLMVGQRGGAQEAVSSDGPSSGMVRVIVQFTEPSVIESQQVSGMSARLVGRAVLQQQGANLRSAKAARISTIASMGGRVQNTIEYALNAAVVDIDASQIESLRRMPGVKAVERAGIYFMSQSQPTVPQLIGTLPVNQAGNSGQGVAIAVIDSGVDYTHASFQGPGTVAYYLAAVAGTGPTVIGDTAGVFPNGPRVKGGYDWLGDTWSGAAGGLGSLTVTPDPDPIDNKQAATDFAGHGTESASAAAGSAVPAGLLQPGSAPQAMVLAYRGCSRLSASCEGSALVNSIDSVVKYALGLPNEGQPGANNPALPEGTRFVLNMSLGAGYGDPLTNSLAEASRAAVRAGVTVVASAGNSNNIPFIVGTPSAADTLISVAASQPALLTGPSLTVGAPLNASYPMVAGSFGVPLTSPLTAPLGFAGPNTAVGNNTNIACSTVGTGTANPGPANPVIPALAGDIGVADRGTCGFNEKALNTQRAGGSASVIVNNAAGTGPIGMAAGPAAVNTTIPSYSLGTAEGLAVRNALSANPELQGTITPLGEAGNVVAGFNIVDLISDFSSRGPSQAGQALKPDITAPGSNIWMADVGTGFGGNNSSGTSFSGPLTAGAAALVLSGRPSFQPWQVKAALMNTADTSVFATKTAAGSTLAGLTRMGAGRVRADLAVATGTLAYDSEDVDPTGGTYYNTAVSFGSRAFTTAGASTASRTVVVQNLSNAAKSYTLSVAARFAADLARGMVFSTSVSTLNVAANSTATFQLVGTATGTQLPTAGGFPLRLMNLDTCTTAVNPPAPVAVCTNKFDDLEQDGFVTISAGANDTVRVPYLMYPRQASSVAVQRVGAAVNTINTGVANTSVDVFNLVGGTDAQDQPDLVPGANVLPVDLRAVGVRYVPNAVPTPPAGATSDVLQFAVSLWNTVATLRSATVNIEIDTDGNGTTDFTVRNLNTTENRNSAFIANSAGVNGNAFFFVDSPLSSKRMTLTVYPAFMNINQSSRIGIRVSSSNGTGPALDLLPNNGAFQYITLNKLVNVHDVRSYALLQNGTRAFGTLVLPGNAAASPGDKGLMVVMAENPTDSDVAIVNLVGR